MTRSVRLPSISTAAAYAAFALAIMFVLFVLALAEMPLAGP